jgi:hypothetical protein
MKIRLPASKVRDETGASGQQRDGFCCFVRSLLLSERAGNKCWENQDEDHDAALELSAGAVSP